MVCNLHYHLSASQEMEKGSRVLGVVLEVSAKFFQEANQGRYNMEMGKGLAGFTFASFHKDPVSGLFSCIAASIFSDQLCTFLLAIFVLYLM